MIKHRRLLLQILILCLFWVGPLFATTLEKGVFLVAKGELNDPRFRGHTILLIQHEARGSAGLVVDRVSRLPISSVVREDSQLLRSGDMLSYGGPVEPKTLLALVKVRKHPPEPSDEVFNNLYVTGLDVLDEWPDFQEEALDYRFFSGYAGWAQGQLAAEVERGDWLVVPAEEGKIFLK